MERPGNYSAFRGNSKLGIKTGLQRPKPLKSSTESRLNFQSNLVTSENKGSLQNDNNPFCKGSSVSSQNLPEAEDVMELFERVMKHLSDKIFKPEVVSAIISLNAALKFLGEHIDASNKDFMDKFQVTMREACKSRELDLVGRLQLLEIIEMRSVKWKPHEDVTNFYRNKLNQVEQGNAQEALKVTSLKERVTNSLKCLAPACLNANAPDFEPLPKLNTNATNHSTNICGRIPQDMKVEIGTHHRRVQIIGLDVTNTNTPKDLVTDTMRHNQSPAPVPPPSPSGDGYGCNWLSGDYAYTIPVGDGNYINIQGNDPELTKAANLVLRDFFHGSTSKRIEGIEEPNQNKKLNYDRATLLMWAESPLCKKLPTTWSAEWERTKAENPNLFRQIISGSEKQSHGLNINHKPAFPNFVKSADEADILPSHSSQILPESVNPRARTIGGKKYDNNNNMDQRKHQFDTKAKTWDEATEQWVEVGGYGNVFMR